MKKLTGRLSKVCWVTTKSVVVLVVAFLCFGGINAHASTIELALLLDGSTSIGDTNWTKQVNAYQSVFSDSFITNYVHPEDDLYVSVYQFGTFVFHEIDMTPISNNAEAAAFGQRIAEIGYRGGWTNTVQAVNDAVNELTTNSINGDRMIIDVSTDGHPIVNGVRQLDESYAAAANALLNGITVNTIGVGDITIVDPIVLETFTESGGGILTTAINFDVFEDSLRERWSSEAQPNPVPEPSTIILLGLGLAGIGFKRWRSN